MTSEKYGLDEIKLVVKLIRSKVTKEHIKWVFRLAEYGFNSENIDKLYDELEREFLPSSLDHTPPSSQPRSDSTVADFESPPSSQGYPQALSSDEMNNRPSEIDSPPYTDEDPWAGLPKDPNYVPRKTICLKTPTNGHHSNNTTTSERRTRDRFVFRTIHQDILNEAFFQNPYPENDEKEILADKCNQALENYKCRALKQPEIMTIHNVTGWFNNRRKEKKRKCYKDINQESTSTPIPINQSTAIAIPPPMIQSENLREELNRVKEEITSDQEDNI